MSVRGRNEVTSRPTVGASQISATSASTMWIGVRFSARTMPAARGRRLRPDSRPGEGVLLAHTTDAVRKRRMLKIMIGIRMTIITTATAAALPNRPDWKPST